jgi:hypothetical protein
MTSAYLITCAMLHRSVLRGLTHINNIGCQKRIQLKDHFQIQIIQEIHDNLIISLIQY